MEVYMDELISSSLVIVRGGRDPSCQIHDLVHDFCSIKARKEKLFDLTSSIGLSSSSSSELMLRRRTIHYNEHVVHQDAVSFLFNPEKGNPYAKHLLSLELQYQYDHYIPYNSHLTHLRLLKRLKLRGIIFTNTFLNEMGMLFHLRWLNIWMVAASLPLSFSNLCNLETLKVYTHGSNLVLSPSIWSLSKLRHVSIHYCSVFVSDIDKPTKLYNLRTLEVLKISGSVDSKDIFKRFPNLRNLEFRMDCSEAEQIYFPRLDVLNKLEKVSARLKFQDWRTHVRYQFDFHFPSSLKELILSGFDLTSDALSRIGRSLPNLHKMELLNASIPGGKEWNMEEVTFQNLKSLTLFGVSFSEWQVIADESFPVLEELEISYCTELKETPESFGDIASLNFISVWGCPQLEESVLKIKEYVAEMTGEDKLEV